MNRWRQYAPPLLMFLLFEGIAITLWRMMDNLFYLSDQSRPSLT